MKRTILVFVLVAVILIGFSLGVSRLETDRHAQDKQLLLDTLHRTAAACYASEGFYPPDIAYMQQRYGLTYDQERFTVEYVVFASNLMPDITVLENAYEK